ncbi:MAG: hypothetical protein ACK5BV_04225 [Bacteroidota bacterium]
MRLTANLHLSSFEQQIIHDTDWIRTKNSLLGKVVDMMAVLSERQQAYLIQENLRLRLPATSPKISKGEKYEGLPYIILDFPRVFSKQDVFAIRTMFWWGKYFSVTLHLKGTFIQQYQSVIHRNLDADNPYDLRISTGEREWMHDLDAADWQMASPEILVKPIEYPFLKIAQKVDFLGEEPVEDVLFSGYKRMLKLLDEDQLPKR